jgi:hypothetical protein
MTNKGEHAGSPLPNKDIETIRVNKRLDIMRKIPYNDRVTQYSRRLLDGG